MTALKERIERIRDDHPWLDRGLRAVQYYGTSNGNQQAGAITYFAFLSFFPILALAFFAVGQVSSVFPDARDSLQSAIATVLPGLVGAGPNSLSLDDFERNATTFGLIGLVGVIYSGLGWLSAMRKSLVEVFELSDQDAPNMVIGKLRDLASLVLLGVILLVSVSVSSFVSSFAAELLDWMHLSTTLSWVVQALTLVVGLGSSTLLFWALFKILARPPLTNRELLSGALLGAVGFEALKRLSSVLLGSTENHVAFQMFGIALILLIWINYFSRLVVFSAGWAHTSTSAVARRAELQAARGQVSGPQSGAVGTSQAGGRGWPPEAVFVAGAGSMLGLVALVRRRGRRD